MKEHSSTNLAVVRQLQHGHYRNLAINDRLSAKVLERYLSDLDPTRSYFLAADIREFELYRHQLDDALKSGNLEPAFKIFNRFQQRVTDRLADLIKRLEDGIEDINFEVEENLDFARKDAPWPSNKDESDELWRKRMKAGVLSLKLADKSFDEITDILIKRYRNQLSNTRQINSEDAFQIYINAFTQTYDPHSQYFSPRVSENFDIHMSLSLEGIGAVLQKENEYTKVVRLVPSGPAEKTKQLKASDRIVGVGQGPDEKIVDVVGWRLDDVVQLIRGPKGTIVRLEIIPADADDEHQTKIIQIVRNTVKLEEQAAKKNIIELQHNTRSYKIGVIDIPTFYMDFKALQAGDSNYKSTTRDVKRLLKELSEVHVDGIIIDLRSNNGGSLQEANSLTGLFIKQGPIVQVRNANGKIEVLGDPDPDIFYSGPLAVLVDRLSASASEIFAGAIQDYCRGIIIGERTFGKGTVQTIISLNRGQLKTTLAKFYRISGESTQHRGVIPDIAYPSLHDMEKIGESALPQALPWDKINPVPYKADKVPPQLISRLQEQHKNRIKDDPDYNYLIEMFEHLKKTRMKKVISLKETTRKKEYEEAKQLRLAVENKRRIAKNLKPLVKLTDLESDGKEGHPNEDDPLLTESGHILLDLISLLTPAPDKPEAKHFSER